MPDRFGPRGVVAVVIPQQNANMQPEYELMRPAGINNQMYRFDISVHDKVPEAVIKTLPQTHGCFPDAIIVGNSFEMRKMPPAEFEQHRAAMEATANGVQFNTAADGCLAALRTLGAKKIGVVSPMTEEYSQSVQTFYGHHGFDAPYAAWLHVVDPKNIIKLTVDDISSAFQTEGFEQCDVILHIGGALGIIGMIPKLEEKIGRPIISSTAAAYWYALRKMGINDTRDDLGHLWTVGHVVED